MAIILLRKKILMLSGGLESQTLLRTPMVLSTGVDGRFNKGIYNPLNSRNFPFDHWALLETDFIRMKSLFANIFMSLNTIAEKIIVNIFNYSAPN